VGVPAADGADDGFDVAGGAVQREVEQHLLGGLRVGHRGTGQHGGVGGDGCSDTGQGGGVIAGDPGDRADLGVGDLACRHRLADLGKVL
jgi:hypothetical protein